MQTKRQVIAAILPEVVTATKAIKTKKMQNGESSFEMKMWADRGRRLALCRQIKMKNKSLWKKVAAIFLWVSPENELRPNNGVLSVGQP